MDYPEKSISFETPKALSEWFNVNHDKEPELWIRMFRKASGIPSIEWEEAVIEALCWGWIDGIRKSLDGQSFIQRYTPRRKKSNWSKRNCEHAERLIKEGRMQAPGLAQVNAAKEDGRWENAYAPPSQMTIPEDFLEALKHNPKAKTSFEALNKSSLFFIGYRLSTAKKAETRQRRFDKIMQMLENGERF